MEVRVSSKGTKTTPNKQERSESLQKDSLNPPAKAEKPAYRTGEKSSPRTGESGSGDRKEVPSLRQKRRPRQKNETAKGESQPIHVNAIATTDEKGETSLDENTARSSKARDTARSSKAGDTARSSKEGDAKTKGNGDGIPVLESTNPDDEKGEGDKAEEPKKKEGPPTPEEMEQRTRDRVEEMQGLCQFMKSNEIKDAEGKFSRDFIMKLESMSRVYRTLEDCPYLVQRKMWVLSGEVLHTSGTVKLLCDVIVNIMDRGFTDAKGEPDDYRSVLRPAMSTLTNSSDDSPSVATDIADHSRYMDRIGQYLSESLQAHLEKSLSDFEQDIVDACLTQVHNISMVEPNETKLRGKKFTQLILPYLKSPFESIRLLAIISLADIVDEKESELLQTSTDSIRFLIDTLNKALKSKQHCHDGWSTVELARAVGRLARNDANKKLLVDMGCLPSLVELIHSDDILETRQGLESVWALSFQEEVKVKVINEDGLMDAVIDRYNNSGDTRVVKLSSGVIWTLRDLLQKDERYKDVVHKVAPTTEDAKEKPAKESVGHIMISYQWDNQAEIKEIAKKLKQKTFKVWLDVENMEGSALQAMAEAVENARVVLICVTQKYKDSPNCRAEAEYAFQLRKEIVPLKMERGYKPDGWLGMILGAKLYFELSTKSTFELRMAGLLKALGTMYSRDACQPTHTPPATTDEIDAKQPNEVSGSALPSDVKVAAMTANNWSQTELQAWKTKHQLTGPNFATLTGRTVSFLVKMRAEAPEFFYRTVESRLRLADLTEFADFIEALEGLFTQG